MAQVRGSRTHARAPQAHAHDGCATGEHTRHRRAHRVVRCCRRAPRLFCGPDRRPGRCSNRHDAGGIAHDMLPDMLLTTLFEELRTRRPTARSRRRHSRCDPYFSLRRRCLRAMALAELISHSGRSHSALNGRSWGAAAAARRSSSPLSIADLFFGYYTIVYYWYYTILYYMLYHTTTTTTILPLLLLCYFATTFTI